MTAATATAASSAGAPTAPSKGLNIALWIVQALLAAAFGFAGFGKLTAPIAELAPRMAWVTTLPPGVVRFIGAAELAGALGLLLPSLTRIQPRLTALAGAGLATIMALAAVFHVSRGEARYIGMNLGLGALAAFVAWGRFKKAPIAAR
jgi:hypothetical protein